MNEIQERERRIKHKLKDYESSFSINGKKIDLSKIKDHSLHIEDFEECRGNTKGNIEVLRKLDNDTLKMFINTLFKNSSVKVDYVTYDEMLINVVIPELINRLDDKGDDTMKYHMNEIEEAVKKSWESKLDLLIYPEEQNMILVRKSTQEDKAYLTKTCIWEPVYYNSYDDYYKDIFKYLNILK